MRATHKFNSADPHVLSRSNGQRFSRRLRHRGHGFAAIVPRDDRREIETCERGRFFPRNIRRELRRAVRAEVNDCLLYTSPSPRD